MYGVVDGVERAPRVLGRHRRPTGSQLVNWSSIGMDGARQVPRCT